MKYIIKTIEDVLERIKAVMASYEKDKKLGKRDLNKLEHCIRILQTTKMQVERDLQPPKPKTLEDSIAWVTTKKKNGTFMALLDANANLIKTMFVTTQLLSKIPEYEILETPTTIKMTKRELVIKELNFTKPIPKKTEGFITIRKEGKKVEVIK